MGNTDRSWKHPLLSTGRPLERSVVECVASVQGLNPIGQFAFDKVGAKGDLVEHSVDLMASYNDIGNDVGVDLLLESKYRNPGTKRIYRRAVPFTPVGPSIVGAFSSTEDLISGTFFNRLTAREYDHSFKFGYAPIEVAGSNGKMTPDCDDGGRQLAHAALARIADVAIDTLRTEVLRFVVPVAVTTCDLRVFKQEPSMEDVHAAKELNDLTESVDVIICRHPVGNVKEHIVRRLASNCTRSERKQLEFHLESRGIHGLAGLAGILSRQMDGTYIVARYEGLVERLERAIRFCVRGIQRKADVRSIVRPSSVSILGAAAEG